MSEKRYKKDLVPIKYRLSMTRNELVGFLNLVRVSAEEGSVDYPGLIDLANDIIKKHKVD